MRILKTVSLLILASLMIVACQNQSKTSENTVAAGVVIFNHETKEISFKEETTDAVRLEYKFTKDTKTENEIAVEIDMEMMGQTMSQAAIMFGNYVITDVDTEGNATIAYTITRMKMDSEALGIHLDTDSTADRNHPQFAPIFGMLDKTVTSKISSTGVTLGLNLGSFLDDMDAEELKMQLEQNMSQLSQSSFPQFPNTEVKAGDSFAGTPIEQNMQGVEIKLNNQYTVRAISKDKAYVILDVKSDFEISNAPVAEVDMLLNEGSVSGWLLVDVSKGFIIKSYATANMDMSVTTQGQNMNMITKTKTFMVTK